MSRVGMDNLKTLQTTLGADKKGDPLSKAFDSLSHESDPQLFYEGLLNLGKGLEVRDRLQEAATVYSAILDAPTQGSELRNLAQQAQARLDAIHGVGSSAARLEFNFHRLAHEAASPTGLFAMGAAGAAFKLTQLAALSRLATTPIGFLGRRAIAYSAAFLAETATFTLAGKTANQLSGVKQDWGLKNLAHEWAGGATMLLGLKVMGGVTGQLAEKIGVLGRAPLQQFGMLSGILLGNKLSELGGFREHHDNATNFADSLVTLLQFNVSGRLLNGVMGEGFHKWEQRAELQSEALAKQSSPLFSTRKSPFADSQFAMAMGPRPGSLDGEGDPSSGEGMVQHPATPSDRPGSTRPSMPPLSGEGWDRLTTPPSHVSIVYKPPARILNNDELLALNQTAREISETFDRAVALARVATQLIRAGKNELGQRHFGRILQELDSVPPLGEGKALAYSHLALELARTGNKAKSLDVFQLACREVSRNKDNPQRFIAIATDMLIAGHANEGRELLELVINSSTPKEELDLYLLEGAAMLAKEGMAKEAKEMAAKIKSTSYYTESLAKIGLALLRRNDFQETRELLQVLEGLREGDMLHSQLAVKFFLAGKDNVANEYLEAIEDAAIRIETVIRTARIIPNRDTIFKIVQTSKAVELLDKYHDQLNPFKRSKLYAMLARNYSLLSLHDEYHSYKEISQNEIEQIIAAGQSDHPAFRETLAEFSLLALQYTPENDWKGWLQNFPEIKRNFIYYRIASGLAEEERIPHARYWINSLPETERSVAQRKISLRLLEQEHEEEALELAQAIPDPKHRFAALHEIYLYRQSLPQDPPTSSNPPPAPGGSRAGGNGKGPPPLPPKKTQGSESLPGINSLNLSNVKDAPSAYSKSSPKPHDGHKRTPLLVEPDLSVFQKTGWKPWMNLGKAQGPASLFLHEDGSVSSSSTAKDETWRTSSDSDRPRGELERGDRISSDPPSGRISFSKEAIRVAADNDLEEWALPHLKHLLQKIQGEMRQVLTNRSFSELAYQVAMGTPVMVRLVPYFPQQKGDLENYRVVLGPESSNKQEDFYEVRYSLNTATGELKPIEFKGHAIWQFQQGLKGEDVSQQFIPFYRLLKIHSEALRSVSLLNEMDPGHRDLVSTRPTMVSDTVLSSPPPGIKMPPPPKVPEINPEPKPDFKSEVWAQYYERKDVLATLIKDVALHLGSNANPIVRSRMEDFGRQILKAMAKLSREGDPQKVMSSSFHYIWVVPKSNNLEVLEVIPNMDAPSKARESMSPPQRRSWMPSLSSILRKAPVEKVVLTMRPLAGGGALIEQVYTQPNPTQADLDFQRLLDLKEVLNLTLSSIVFPSPEG